jgi:hypothetical protein
MISESRGPPETLRGLLGLYATRHKGTRRPLSGRLVSQTYSGFESCVGPVMYLLVSGIAGSSSPASL